MLKCDLAAGGVDHSLRRRGGLPALVVSAYDLPEGKGSQQYAEDLGHSVGLKPECPES